ncbi:DUF397 domain-containing protein [Streptomyces sp. PT12]|uniref:DUF397 domain-containing protein n=1 Tax=Streptomyces sp. PT12 TaxID=1510197 RepID=UPI000DE1B578|nr:DUF397 domain-containing protein [Streptomyces sp. PT12]RBM07327.1 DUF397 domain-containing protein [Streptomyces sp. PT12]
MAANRAPLNWRKSSYSGSENGACVEVADGIPHVVPVRDSKTKNTAELSFSTASWHRFITAVTAGTLPTA